MPDLLMAAVPNEEAARFVASKMPVSRSVFDRLLPQLKARAICITGIEDLNAVQRVRDAIAAIPEGADWEEAKEMVLQDIGPYMVTSAEPVEMAAQIAAAERRAELLLRTHGFQAYAAAEYESLDEQRDVFPYWEYVTARDGNVRDAHAALDGLLIPADSDFWATHYPPWDWGCRCQVRPRLASEAADMPRAGGAIQREAVGPTGGRAQQRVVEGGMLRQLEQGSLVQDGRRLDIRAPIDQGQENAYSWKPGDLRLPVASIKDRYDTDTWKDFEGFAKRTDAGNGGSVWDWLQET